jgi:hypothetical protein
MLPTHQGTVGSMQQHAQPHRAFDDRATPSRNSMPKPDQLAPLATQHQGDQHQTHSHLTYIYRIPDALNREVLLAEYECGFVSV